MGHGKHNKPCRFAWQSLNRHRYSIVIYLPYTQSPESCACVVELSQLACQAFGCEPHHRSCDREWIHRVQ